MDAQDHVVLVDVPGSHLQSVRFGAEDLKTKIEVQSPGGVLGGRNGQCPKDASFLALSSRAPIKALPAPFRLAVEVT